MVETPLLQMRGIVKSFPGVMALRNVDLDVWPGEVHGLVGHNGAGKSTLIKILTGAYTRDAGTILLGGEPVNFSSPAAAQAGGIATIYQETSLVPYLSAAENIFLGREPRNRWGAVDWRAMRREAASLLDRLGVQLDVRLPTMRLSIALQQMVMLARAICLNARLVVMDEPTSSLDTHEVRILFDVIHRFQQEGVGIIYVSHRLDEIFELTGRVTILRDGQLVRTVPTAEITKHELVALMLARKADEVSVSNQTAFKESATTESRRPLLEVEHLTRRPAPVDVSLTVGEGEIVGLAGLLGSGRTELARTIFGADRPERGTIRVLGRPVRIRSPRDAVRAGLGYTPEDRKTEGIVPQLGVRDNIVLASLPRFARFGILSLRRQRAVADALIKRLDIRTPGPNTPVRNLSGGNQQKVILARWLCRRPHLLLMDEPTRGIDVGAKAEVQRLIDEIAQEGVGILMISSELEEVIEGSDRVVVMQDGHKAGELLHNEASEESILRLISEDSRHE